MALIENCVKDTANMYIRKYTTALAFAIIKLKSNVTTQEFCDTIKEQFENVNLDNMNNSLHLEQSQRDALLVLSESNDLFSTNQPISQETCEIVNKLKLSFNADETKDTHSTISKDFEVLLAIENVKKLICFITGALTNNSQDSGYRSSQNSLGSLRKKTSEMANLNRSLLVLVAYLNDVSMKTFNKDIVSLVSKVFGTALDQLFQKNIYLSFYDTVVDALDNMIEKLRNNETEDVESLLLRINLLNKSYILINHSLMRLTDELQSSIMKISLCGPTDAIEMTDSKTINLIFYIFHLFEILLKRKNNLKKKLTSSSDGQSKEIENVELFANEDRLQNNNYGKLFSKIILELSETYPLIAFWAMECYNINLEGK